MSDDFYCDQVLTGRCEIEKVLETDAVLAYHHTRPFWETHIVVIPKQHISSLLAIDANDGPILMELFDVIRKVAGDVVGDTGAARVLTNIGRYQDSKHLHFHVYSGERLREDEPT